MGNLDFTYNNQRLMGYLAEPAELIKGGVVVIQEWWGLTPDIAAIADRYAAEGFLAWSPDLYHGESAEEPDDARKLAMSLERDTAALEIDAAIAWLKDDRSAGKVGCLGYCMGGGLTLATAIRTGSRVDSVHVYYGGGMPPSEEITKITVPVLGSYGSLDTGLPIEQVDMLRETLSEAGVENDVTFYEGAEHSFFNDTRPSFHPEAAADSWQKSVDWFSKPLS